MDDFAVLAKKLLKMRFLKLLQNLILAIIHNDISEEKNILSKKRLASETLGHLVNRQSRLGIILLILGHHPKNLGEPQIQRGDSPVQLGVQISLLKNLLWMKLKSKKGIFFKLEASGELMDDIINFPLETQNRPNVILEPLKDVIVSRIKGEIMEEKSSLVLGHLQSLLLGKAVVDKGVPPEILIELCEVNWDLFGVVVYHIHVGVLLLGDNHLHEGLAHRVENELPSVVVYLFGHFENHSDSLGVLSDLLLFGDFEVEDCVLLVYFLLLCVVGREVVVDSPSDHHQTVDVFELLHEDVLLSKSVEDWNVLDSLGVKKLYVVDWDPTERGELVVYILLAFDFDVEVTGNHGGH